MEVKKLEINGLLLFSLDVRKDSRGSFAETFQKEKLIPLGLPEDFVPVQQNISHSKYGVIRGIHAEPWDKYIHVPYGKVYANIVDLRPDSPTFRKISQAELDENNALFVPKGCGNSFVSITPKAVYTYLVNSHWRPDLKYEAIAYDDPDLNIQWPIPKDKQIVSEKDQNNPTMKEVFGE